ncbi:hypothetical protein M0805_008352 [Coniferiporia weirii]|nr:hypothetical protein M0805_008352 [Coniferiporia weirii]
MSSSSSTHTLAQVIVVLTSIVVGFKLGSRSWFSANEVEEPEESGHLDVKSQAGNSNDTEERPEEVADGDFAAVSAKSWEPCKLVLVVRTDLKLWPGDIAAHNATLACYKALTLKNPKLVRHWEVTGQAKIALKGTSEEQLLELEAIAKSLNLCARVVHDKELTKDKEGTRTVLGIGPAPVELINQVTGKLRLL